MAPADVISGRLPLLDPAILIAGGLQRPTLFLFSIVTEEFNQ
jgi:hypothetical protein